jgi:hypothetical protein
MSGPGPGGDPSGGDRHCAGCGAPLAPGAAFCRSCGTRYEEQAPPLTATAPRVAAPATPQQPRRSRVAIWVGVAIVLIGAGVATAILLANGGGSSSTTVLVGSNSRGGAEASSEAATAGTTSESVQEAATDSVEAGRYVQAGSFKTVPHANAERERLAAAGIDVQVVSSDGVEELYPGFQVLLGGPLAAGSQEASMVKALHRNGVPSAFARDVTPALEIDSPAETAGRWSGVLDRSSGERPSLSGPLTVSLEMDSGGRSGTLEFSDPSCRDELTLSETTPTTLAYAQGQPCIGAGNLLVRPAGGQLMLTLQPIDTDVLVLGSLSPG